MQSEIESLSDPKITCENCKASCCHLDAMLFNDTGIPDEFVMQNEQGSESMLRLADGWCAALDRTTMRCSIYEIRPWICREFDMGDSECLAARADYP